jgi:hypothetical protein
VLVVFAESFLNCSVLVVELSDWGPVSQYRGHGWPIVEECLVAARFARIAAFSWGKHADRHQMNKYPDELKLLVELDERHDELLRELDDLDKQVETVLAVWLADREARLKAAA